MNSAPRPYGPFPDPNVQVTPYTWYPGEQIGGEGPLTNIPIKKKM